MDDVQEPKEPNEEELIRFYAERSVQWKSMGVTAIAAENPSVFECIAGMESEKKRREYYQTIVCEVCNIVDAANGKRAGTGIVCGTIEHDEIELQKAVEALVSERDRLKKTLSQLATDLGAAKRVLKSLSEIL